MSIAVPETKNFNKTNVGWNRDRRHESKNDNSKSERSGVGEYSHTY